MSEWEAIGKSDDWYTPAYIFDALGLMFHMDVSAPPEGPRHVPCHHWISQHGLESEWSGLVWMNPPFGPRNGIVPWIERFMTHGNGVALTPDRTSAPWWQCAAKKAHAILFVSPKVKFERPDGSIGKSPGGGVSLFAMGEEAVSALFRAEGRLGVVLRPR